MSDRAKAAYFFLAVGLLALAYLYGEHRLKDHPKSGNPAVTAKRNVYLITASGLRPDHLSLYGYQPIQTPQIDFLAQDGVRFKHALTNSPQSLLAHLSMLTGLYPFRDSVQALSGSQPGAATLPQTLQQKGYRTAAFLADPDLKSSSMSRLFMETQMADTPGASYNLAKQWILRHRNESQFVLLNLNEPTYPFEPPPPYGEHYKNHPYDGEIAAVDAIIGLLTDMLQNNNLYQNSVIVFTAPYGSELADVTGEPSTQEDMLSVPLFIVAMGILPEYRTYENQVSLVDIFPTVLTLLKLERPPTQLDGMPLFERGRTDELYRELIYGATVLPDGSLQYFAHSQSGDLYAGEDARKRLKQ